MASKRERIIAKAIELLKENPQGIRYSKLIKALKEQFPDFPENTIHGTIWNLDIKYPKEIYKPERGLWKHASFKDAQTAIPLVPREEAETEIAEEDFYEPFADYLTKELEECTRAVKVGGSRFGPKWGTPDVIGVYESKPRGAIIEFREIICAEIKIDTSGLITAFGQACAYKLFSHKVYIVIPKSANNEDKSRLESLCLIFGIGLILFDNENVESPDFEIRVRPIKQDPDMFYVNHYMEKVPELFP